MSVDEQVEFLRQSVESHDRQIGELVERMDQLSERMDQAIVNIEKLAKVAEGTQHNFDRLTNAVMALTEHVVERQRRTERSET